MKFYPALFLSIIMLLTAGCATPPGQHKTTENRGMTKGKRMVVRTTAYTHTEAGGGKNAVGNRLRFGGLVSSAASDWSWLPLGTRFRVIKSGRIYVIEDYGSALVGRQTVDLYKPSRAAMRAWGTQHVEIEILEWGSRAMSLKLLEPRQRNQHVRKMVNALRSAR